MDQDLVDKALDTAQRVVAVERSRPTDPETSSIRVLDSDEL